MGRTRGLLAAALIAVLPQILSACSKPVPPVGKWEGGTERGGTLVAARVEILAGGGVRVMAPDITNVMGPREQIERLRDRLASDLATNWDFVKPRMFDFDGRIFRKPGGIAPQMEWDKATNQLTLDLYIGTRPAFPVTLRPVDSFHDNPFASG